MAIKKIALAISIGGAGDAAEAQNTCDQRDDQKRNDPAQHDTTSIFCFSRDGATERRASTDKTIRPGNEGSGQRNREISRFRRNKIAAKPRKPARQKRRDKTCQNGRTGPIWPSIPAMKAPLYRLTVPSWGQRRFENDRAEQTAPSRRPRAPARGWRHRRACAGRGRPAISQRAQSRAARRGRDAGWAGAGAGRRRHRQDPRADHAHRPHPEPGPRAAAAKSCR